MRSNARRIRWRTVLAPTIAGAAAVSLLAAGSMQWANAGNAPQHEHPPASASAPHSVPGTHGAAGAPAPGYIKAPVPVLGVKPSTKVPPHKMFREFQANCAVSRSNLPDDPIVFPGMAGAAHLHTFMGNTTTNAKTTTASLLAGGTRCLAPGDRSAYWMPTLLKGDRAINPVGVQTIYYKTGVRDYTSVRPFPTGLRYVVGDPKATATEFYRSPGTVEGFECGDDYRNADIPSHCPEGSRLNVRYQAPSCWDGKHLDSPDHKSHMAYPVTREGVCPASHPVAVPMLEFKMAWPVSGDMSKVRFSSGRGFSFHYDFMNAWDEATLKALVKACINGGRQCSARGWDEREPERTAVLDRRYRLR